jgi:23S rRNA (guanine745-N1)-methyltransferase
MALVREERRLLCPRGHSFDVARSGYINLLQPQERRSKQPGDTPAAVAGRRRLHDRGATQPLLQAIAEIAAAAPSDTVLDAGCGDGFYLGSLAGQTCFDAHGVAISIPAVHAVLLSIYRPMRSRPAEAMLMPTASCRTPTARSPSSCRSQHG